MAAGSSNAPSGTALDGHSTVVRSSRPNLAAEREVGVGDDDALGRNRDGLDRHVLQVVIGSVRQAAAGDQRDDKDRKDPYAIHMVLIFYCASFRISAVARIVMSSPVLVPGTTSRATGCRMMNSNG